MYFQNPFFEEYQGYFYLGGLAGGDALTFPGSRLDKTRFQHWGRGMVRVESVVIPSVTDLTGNDADGNPLDTLTINFAIDPTLREFATIALDITTAAAAPGATTVLEMAESLNNNPNFSSFFTASTETLTTGDAPTRQLIIEAKRSAEFIKFYISNTGAETILLFNRAAGVAELPSYFARHTVENRHNFRDGVALLVPLSRFITSITAANPGIITSVGHGLTTGDTIVIEDSDSGVSIDGNRVATVIDDDTFHVGVDTTAGAAGDYGVWARRVDADVIANAINRQGKNLGFTLAATQQDYQLLAGRASGLYDFTKSTYSGGNLVEEIIYPAGATVGGAAKRVIYVYSGADLIEKMEVPHVLTAGDLITP
jgi:hypothetical protein